MDEFAAPETPAPEKDTRNSGPLLGILIGAPVSIALWLGIVWLFF